MAGIPGLAMDFRNKLLAIFESEFKYSSTQVNLDGELAQKVLEFGRDIPKEELAEKGLEDQPHITVKYGIHDQSPKAVEEILDKEDEEISATLGLLDVFKADEHDVLIINVTSDDLHRLNRLITNEIECTDTHPGYKPHVTVAFLKSGEGDKYIGRDDFAGDLVEISEIHFSDRDKNQKSIDVGAVSRV